MCFRKCLDNRRLEQRIKRLSDEERRAILAASPLEIGWFQGEGYHVFLKSEPDFTKAYVDSLGEVDRPFAEDWIIRRYLLTNPDRRSQDNLT